MPEPLKFRLVAPVYAVQWNGENKDEIKEFVDGDVTSFSDEDLVAFPRHGQAFRIGKLDWAVKGTHGETYPCANDDFQQLYDEIFELDGSTITDTVTCTECGSVLKHL